MVAGAIALLAVLALVAFNSLMDQKRLTQTAADIVSIRSAVNQWRAGGVITVVKSDAIDRDRTLGKWNQLSGFLPNHLDRLAQRNGTNLLEAANPWGGNYSIFTPNGRRMPVLPTGHRLRLIGGGVNTWFLNITGIPEDLVTPLSNQIRNSTDAGVAAAGGSSTDIRLTFDE